MNRPNDIWATVRHIADEDQQVAKFVFEKGNAVAEAVLYRYPDYATRTVICCSTQSGCPIGCRFCGAGDAFVRSLHANEITEQVDFCLARTGVSPREIERLQIMFMSMGEPLLNLNHLIPAIRRLHRDYPQAELLISTSAPRIDLAPIHAISRDIPKVGLQFSIHESTDEARDLLIPFKAKLTLREIADAGRGWHAITERQPYINYCAHERNTSEDDADRLVELFLPIFFKATVSVVCERDDGMPTSNARQHELASDFAAKLIARGFDVRVFDPAGQDTIGGGCGQLWFVQEWMRSHPQYAHLSVGHAQPVIHAPRGDTT